MRIAVRGPLAIAGKKVYKKIKWIPYLFLSEARILAHWPIRPPQDALKKVKIRGFHRIRPNRNQGTDHEEHQKNSLRA
jgi:hypothetical protein